MQEFLWRFEQGGYSKDSMQDVLSFFEKALASDAHQIGDLIGIHMDQMMKDCHAYVEGKGSPQNIIRDLNQIRQDLEE